MGGQKWMSFISNIKKCSLVATACEESGSFTESLFAGSGQGVFGLLEQPEAPINMAAVKKLVE